MDFVAAEKMNDAWMASPTHRANIMNNKYTDIGIGIVRGVIDSHETTVVVQIFGSGNKNISSEEKMEESGENSQDNNKKNSELPRLPLGQQKTTKLAFALSAPVIMYPMNEGIIPDEKVLISGRALPGSKVTIYDNNNLIGENAADENGWFKVTAGNLSSGSHNLIARSQALSNTKFNLQSVSKNIIFAIDRNKPEIRYKMEETSSNRANGYALKVFLNKPNCLVKFAGQAFSAGNTKSITVFAPKSMLSAVIKVEDSAGNSAVKVADFSNYYEAGKNQTLVNRFAQALTGGGRFANSGREAFAKNLGLKLADSNY